MKRYFLKVCHDENCWCIETSEKNFNRILNDISKEYDIKKDKDIDGSVNYYTYDEEKYNLIGYIKEDLN